MGCLQPLSILDKNRATPSTDGRINVPCGRCHRCKQKRRMDWTFRLLQELRDSSTSYFITLTYNEENKRINRKTGIAELSKSDLQRFIKRFRKRQSDYYLRKYPKITSKERRKITPVIRYYACGEYGTDSQRPHYHLIVFNANSHVAAGLPSIWGLGHAHVGTANVKTIMYTTKYIMKSSYETEEQGLLRTPEFSLQSTKPAIGSGFLVKNQKVFENNPSFLAYNQQGKKQRLPKYFKEKLYAKDLRKRIAEEELKEADKAHLKEVKRIEALGNTIGKYEHDQLHDEIRRIHKSIKESEKL